ncbi:MAG TPA: CcmD family protein [Bacteroidales bacterium]|nr:CcmD family protein [Bacteroidales bacterium]HPT03030.1 CcmD family protein [Bacteroidales bacterium]
MIESKLIAVIAVLATVFIGLAVYLFLLDRKIGKLENQLKERREKR